MSVLPIDIKSFMSSLAATKESVECRLVMSIDVHYIAARSVTVGERELIGPSRWVSCIAPFPPKPNTNFSHQFSGRNVVDGEHKAVGRSYRL